MHKIKIRLPATIPNLGPELNSLGLALGLYTTVEIFERTDESLVIETGGEGAKHYDSDFYHPVVLALIRMFQRLERAPLGITIKIDNQIPLNSGLGAEVAFTVAGVIAANNLLGNTFTRQQMLEIASQITQSMDSSSIFPCQSSVLTAVLGGMTTSITTGETLIYRTLPVSPVQVVVVLPDLPDYTGETIIPDRIPLPDVIHNINRVPLLVTALQDGDIDLLQAVLDDKVRIPLLIGDITGYDSVVTAAKAHGAKAVTLSGDGPAVLAFADDQHEAIAEAMVQAFEQAEIEAQSWVLPVDTQGLVLSVMQSA